MIVGDKLKLVLLEFGDFGGGPLLEISLTPTLACWASARCGSVAAALKRTGKWVYRTRPGSISSQPAT